MHRKLIILPALIAIAAILFSLAPARAQSNPRYFPETQHNVSGVFLDYWTAHGGLAQQGYPLTEEFKEVSATNNQEYTVQYFERAVFELHPENAAPNNVLLSLLGNFLYKSKYPSGAPGQVASTENPRLFTETGKTLGGKFRAYWEANGGLAQQGFPISDEFQEKSDLNGQTYTVQYFERSVFEYHPENAAPYDVLLSQLGKFQLNTRYPNGSNPAAAPVGSGGIVPNPTETVPAAAPTGTTAPAAPTNTTAPQATNTPVPAAPTNTPVAAPPTNTFCQPPAGSGYTACAVVNDATPLQNSDVRITGVLYNNGQPVQGAIMNSTWHYKSTDTPCNGAKTGADGVAGCTNGIGRASVGFSVIIDVRFVDVNGNALASARTSFTPR